MRKMTMKILSHIWRDQGKPKTS